MLISGYSSNVISLILSIRRNPHSGKNLSTLLLIIRFLSYSAYPKFDLKQISPGITSQPDPKHSNIPLPDQYFWGSAPNIEWWAQSEPHAIPCSQGSNNPHIPDFVKEFK
jgi:hypothetical protein